MNQTHVIMSQTLEPMYPCLSNNNKKRFNFLTNQKENQRTITCPMSFEIKLLPKIQPHHLSANAVKTYRHEADWIHKYYICVYIYSICSILNAGIFRLCFFYGLKFSKMCTELYKITLTLRRRLLTVQNIRERGCALNKNFRRNI